MQSRASAMRGVVRSQVIPSAVAVGSDRCVRPSLCVRPSFMLYCSGVRHGCCLYAVCFAAALTGRLGVGAFSGGSWHVLHSLAAERMPLQLGVRHTCSEAKQSFSAVTGCDGAAVGRLMPSLRVVSGQQGHCRQSCPVVVSTPKTPGTSRASAFPGKGL
eukprot:2701-Heterococcus_DN1.PRE.1